MQRSTISEFSTSLLPHSLHGFLPALATPVPLIPFSLNGVFHGRLVQEVVNLKSGAFVSKQEASEEYLRSTIENLTACVSAFHQQRHTMLLSELLSIPLWESGQASSSLQLLTLPNLSLPLSIYVLPQSSLHEPCPLIILAASITYCNCILLGVTRVGQGKSMCLLT